MLIATYGPAAAYLGSYARELLHKGPYATQISDPEQWLRSHGLFFTLSEQLPQIGVMLAPMLAGPPRLSLDCPAESSESVDRRSIRRAGGNSGRCTMKTGFVFSAIAGLLFSFLFAFAAQPVQATAYLSAASALIVCFSSMGRREA
ncbi:MAG: hypothetical protein ICV76_01360 [Nitrospiraceae bacterium]|nr:hypothetical protein [Nitrospiraceae bacterium]